MGKIINSLKITERLGEKMAIKMSEYVGTGSFGRAETRQERC